MYAYISKILIILIFWGSNGFNVFLPDSRVHHGAQKMSQLIDDMLKLSRVSRTEIKIQKVNLSSIAEEIANDLQSTESDRNVDFTIQKDIFINGDRQLLRIVLNNLMENAWKFTSTFYFTLQ